MKGTTTHYGGRRFRSKTEARWAHVMDALGIAFEYEPECVHLTHPSTGRLLRYLPDFRLPGLGCWFEIKNRGTAPPTPEESLRARLLAEQTGMPCFVFFGDPIGTKNFGRGNAYRYDVEGQMTPCWQFTECPVCKTIGLTVGGRIGGLDCECAVHDFDNRGSERIVGAVRAAMATRFHCEGW